MSEYCIQWQFNGGESTFCTIVEAGSGAGALRKFEAKNDNKRVQLVVKL
jgi:hypothetical protein